MVLNNPNPYSSEEDSDIEPWEFISEPQLGAELQLEESTENEGDGVSRTPDGEGMQLGEGQNSTDVDGAIEEAESEVGVTSGASAAVDNEDSANDENSSGVCDEAKETKPTVDANDENTDPWTPLNAEDVPRDRSESPEQHLPLPLHQTWNFITSSLRDLDNQNQLRQRAQTGARKLNTSAQNLWTNLQSESQRLATTLQQHCDQADTQAREASQNIKRTVSSTKDNICRLNAEYKIHEKVAAVAAVSGAILVAAGNPRAGAGTLLVAGGALAAGEALNAGSESGCSTFTRDYGLREGVHLD